MKGGEGENGNVKLTVGPERISARIPSCGLGARM
jgi:hypothetical protein